jgi:hypothetical protein
MDPSHGVVSIDDLYGRECLIAAVWGPPRSRLEQLHTRQRTNQALSGMAALGSVAGMLASTVLFPAAGAATALLGGALSGSLFWLCGKRVVSSTQPTYPVSAEPLQLPAVDLHQHGTVRGSMDLVAPASGCGCVAYAIELRHEDDFGARVMFRDAICSGFEVVLEDGQSVRVPAGRIRFFGAMHQQVDFDNVLLETYMDRFDPRRSPSQTFDPLRYNVVYEQVIFPNDRVHLTCELQSTVDNHALPPSYREAMPTYLTPRGIPGFLLSEVSPRLALMRKYASDS